MEAEASPESRSKAPPTLSPVTVWNFIETHRRTLPSRIDKSLMNTLAGGDRPKMLWALEFLGLIEPSGKPTTLFARLQAADSDEAEVKRAWADALEGAYPLMFKGFDLSSATQAQIDERFKEEFKIQGDTVRKAGSFFLALARNAGIPLSTYVKGTRPRGGRPPGTRRSTTTRHNTPKPSPAPPSDGGSSRTIDLRSGGGSITLSVSIDPMVGGR